MALGWCIWVRKWLDPDLDRKVSERNNLGLNLLCFVMCMWTRKWHNQNLNRKNIQMKTSGSKSAIALGLCFWVGNGLIQIRIERCPNEAIWKHICNGFGDVYAKRGVGQLADAPIRPDLSRQARQARQARQMSGQKPG